MGDFVLKIGYVKLKKKPDSKAKRIVFSIKSFFNTIDIEKMNKDVFIIYNKKSGTIKKLKKYFNRLKIDDVLTEKGEQIDYNSLDGKLLSRYMLPETIDFCYRIIKPKKDEIYVCVNKYDNENIELLMDIAKRQKVLNIVTHNSNFLLLEKELEKNNIFITVSANKRRALKNAEVVINIDFADFDEYNINRNMILIDLTQSIKVPNSFNGIIIKNIIIDTKKIMRVFNEFENFDRSKLLEAEIIKQNSYRRAREYISINKFDIVHCINERKIGLNEFERISKAG